MIGSHEVVLLDPFLDPPGAAAMLELSERFGTYRTYGEHEQIETEVGRGLTQRHDSVQHFLRTGGLHGAREPVRSLAARTSYFREEYAYGTTARVAGIEPFLHHPALIAAAQQVHARPVIEPAIAYANLMVPGQELAVHTDVPEFRGANRKVMPQWLLVVMHHSGLFDAWRLPIATGIAWFQDSDGGALAYWPTGPDGPQELHPTRANTAMVLDTDTVFHGVDRVAGHDAPPPPPITVGTMLTPVGDGRWQLADPDGAELAEYGWDDLRFSVSWKAYCFTDDRERAAWRDHSDDLTLDRVLDRLVDDLRERGVVSGPVARTPQLGLQLIDEYVRFPAPA